jgi:hypothetical protein
VNRPLTLRIRAPQSSPSKYMPPPPAISSVSDHLFFLIPRLSSSSVSQVGGFKLNRNQQYPQQQHQQHQQQHNITNMGAPAEPTLSQYAEINCIPSTLPKARQRRYTRDHLSCFDLIDTPIWVFDPQRKSMWWANEAACYLWSADSCKDLVQRDFASDMSKASENMMNKWLGQFHRGEESTKQTVRRSKGSMQAHYISRKRVDSLIFNTSTLFFHVILLVDVSSQWRQRRTQNVRIIDIGHLYHVSRNGRNSLMHAQCGGKSH